MRLFSITITDPELRRKLGGSLFTVVGLIFLTISLFGLYRSIRFVREGVSIEATLVGYRERHDSGGDVFFTPEFSFVDQRGETVVQVYTVGTDRKQYEVGEKVGLLMLVPDSAIRINNFEYLWLSEIINAFVGSICLVVGVLVLKGIIKAGPLE